jgi:hypothetical protein
VAEFIGQSGGVYLFDYIPLSEESPRSVLGQGLHMVRKHVFKSRPDFAYDQRTRNDVIADLKAAGFKDVQAFATGDIAGQWSLPESSVSSQTIIYSCRNNSDDPHHPPLANQTATRNA